MAHKALWLFEDAEGSAVDGSAGFGVDFVALWAAAGCETVLEQGLAHRWSFLRCPGLYF